MSERCLSGWRKQRDLLTGQNLPRHLNLGRLINRAGLYFLLIQDQLFESGLEKPDPVVFNENMEYHSLDSTQAYLFSDGKSRPLVVPCEKNNSDSHSFQGSHSCLSFHFHRIRYGHHCHQGTWGTEEDDEFPENNTTTSNDLQTEASSQLESSDTEFAWEGGKRRFPGTKPCYQVIAGDQMHMRVRSFSVDIPYRVRARPRIKIKWHSCNLELSYMKW